VTADPDVSVVVPVRNGATSIGRLLDALAQQEPVRFEVIVVDNGSTDGTGDVARRHPLEVRVVEESRPGSYAARNAGLAVARAPVLAFTDADCTPEPSWLRAGLAVLDEGGADLAGGAVQAVPSTNATVWERYDRAVYLRQRDLVEHHEWAVTANLFVRRAVTDVIGGFDASLPSSGDREFCLRAGRAGFRIVYAPDAVVGHQPRTSMRETWTLNRRVGAGMGMLSARGELPPWWRMREHWMKLDWVIVLISRDGLPLRRRHVLPVHAVAMTARLYGRLRRR
jgi:glycosyltransferase involved in cell wall biosynthesis